MPAALVECSFFIPMRRDKEISDGKSHTAASWDWLQDELLELFDGWTLAPGEFEGRWKGPKGSAIYDQSRQYIVAVKKSRLQNLRALLREACVVFRQQAIYLSIGGKIEFIEDPQDASPT